MGLEMRFLCQFVVEKEYGYNNVCIYDASLVLSASGPLLSPALHEQGTFRVHGCPNYLFHVCLHWALLCCLSSSSISFSSVLPSLSTFAPWRLCAAPA